VSDHYISAVRRLVLAVAALAAPAAPVLVAAPADALATNVICVGSPTGPCDVNAGSISAAIALADANGVADTIFVGPGTYNDGPWQLDADDPLTLKGSGQGSTILTLPPGGQQTYLMLNGAQARDLTVQLATSSFDGDKGISVYNGGFAQAVTVQGAGTTNTTGVVMDEASLADATILMDPAASPSTRGVYSDGGNLITDTAVTAGQGYNMSSPGASDLLARLHISASDEAVVIDGGTVNVDDTVIDLGTSNGTGLAAVNYNAGTSDKIINADHVTIAGGGAGSTGVLAAATNPNAKQLSAVNLSNSIVVGPEKSLVAQATNNGGVGGDSSAFVNVSWTDWDPDSKVVTIGANGVGDVVSGAGNVDVAPGFVDAAAGDFRLAATSPLVDAGNPAAGGPSLDLAKLPRVADGDGNGSAVRDMGAYERAAPPPVPDTTAPQTTITKKPAKKVTSKKVTFRFTSDEAGSTFQCQRDAKAWKPCSSAYRFKVRLGKHVFRVRAVDAAGNVDATPARYRFTRVPKPEPSGCTGEC
jgi:hypothetical protein